MGVKFGTEDETFGPILCAKFHPHRCNVSPLRGENLQNRPLSKLNNRRFALHAMLPVNKIKARSVRPCTNCSLYRCAYDVHNYDAQQHRAGQTISSLTLQTITIAHMLSVGVEGDTIKINTFNLMIF